MLGIIGMGSIGKAVVRRATEQGMEISVIAWSRNLTSEIAVSLGIELAESPLEVAAKADVVSVHLAATPETRHFINADLNVFGNEPTRREVEFEAIDLAAVSTCTPHIGASTAQAAEGVDDEVVNIFSAYCPAPERRLTVSTYRVVHWPRIILLWATATGLVYWPVFSTNCERPISISRECGM